MSWLRFLHSQSFEQSLILQPSQAASLRQRRGGGGMDKEEDAGIEIEGTLRKLPS